MYTISVLCFSNCYVNNHITHYVEYFPSFNDMLYFLNKFRLLAVFKNVLDIPMTIFSFLNKYCCYGNRKGDKSNSIHRSRTKLLPEITE